ncbi:unnamed protein product [Callosobruchus maculatus]|uniref:Coiled-coil domain-containing protein 112 n=3 Tax=Callosobruchus maculatus TaxID=64391 RepID=A0A653CDE9_CALMS|nr:unnamed protein product [Callosobruchus maculatus]
MSESVTVELNKLSTLQNTLEKAINYILAQLKKYGYDFLDYEHELEMKRKEEKQNLTVKITSLIENIHSKQQLLRNKTVDIIDVEGFKREMICIQDQIEHLKYEARQKLKELTYENDDLSEEIQFYNSKMLEWSEPMKINIYCNSNPIKPKSVSKQHQSKEAKEFMDFVHKSGGHENGWRKEDHQLFIKLRTKHKDSKIVAENLHDMLPDISIQDVYNHEEWYKRYLELNKRKKEAISHWKRSKNSQSTNKSHIESRYAQKLNLEPDNKKHMQEKLMKWKETKQKQYELARKIETERQIEKKELDELRKKRNEEIRQVVNEWKMTKAALEEEKVREQNKMEQIEKRKRAVQANKLIRQYQSQDDLYIARLRKIRERDKRKPERSKSSQPAPRDPDRLLKPTIQWMNRVHDENNSLPSLPAFSLNNLPKLKVPEWRRKME